MTDPALPIEVEINLRIPNVKEPATDAKGFPIVNADVRFIRVVGVAVMPQAGSTLDLHTRDGVVLRCDVLSAAWNDQAHRFTVYCRYAKRSMPQEEYVALVHDPDWRMRPLL